MNEKELKRAKEFLRYFMVDPDLDTIYLTSGGNSCIMNPKSEWKEFLGYSVNSVAEAVARKLNKPTKWIE